MKNVLCCGFVSAVLAISVAAGAQDKMDKMDKMGGMKPETSYTGCVERSPEGALTLAHAAAEGAMGKKSMSKDSMANDAMAHDSMMKDGMAPSLGLSSTSVDLGQHIGQKVTVKGVEGDKMNGMASFTVKAIKVVAKSCS